MKQFPFQNENVEGRNENNYSEENQRGSNSFDHSNRDKTPDLNPFQSNLLNGNVDPTILSILAQKMNQTNNNFNNNVQNVPFQFQMPNLALNPMNLPLNNSLFNGLNGAINVNNNGSGINGGSNSLVGNLNVGNNVNQLLLGLLNSVHQNPPPFPLNHTPFPTMMQHNPMMTQQNQSFGFNPLLQNPYFNQNATPNFTSSEMDPQRKLKEIQQQLEIIQNQQRSITNQTRENFTFSNPMEKRHEETSQSNKIKVMIAKKNVEKKVEEPRKKVAVKPNLDIVPIAKSNQNAKRTQILNEDPFDLLHDIEENAPKKQKVEKPIESIGSNPLIEKVETKTLKEKEGKPTMKPLTSEAIPSLLKGVTVHQLTTALNRIYPKDKKKASDLAKKAEEAMASVSLTKHYYSSLASKFIDKLKIQKEGSEVSIPNFPQESIRSNLPVKSSSNSNQSSNTSKSIDIFEGTVLSNPSSIKKSSLPPPKPSLVFPSKSNTSLPSKTLSAVPKKEVKKSIGLPAISLNPKDKVNAIIRQKFLEGLYNKMLEVYGDPEYARDEAVREEKEINSKSLNKSMYQSLSGPLFRKLSLMKPLSIEELDKKKKESKGEKEEQSEGVIKRFSSKSSIKSIDLPREKMEELSVPYLLSLSRLEELDYPTLNVFQSREESEELKEKEVKEDDIQTCTRCKQQFSYVYEEGKLVLEKNCVSHTGKLRVNRSEISGRSRTYTCCGGTNVDLGCTKRDEFLYAIFYHFN
eukprot:TRINITY_DN5508_c0_g1_i3.p1 TRINITY_DN5508_c0_g1~~TRINITY_DN5508_c0_g1_i3.p1  ORF type:complete len:745 (+),score=303.93 TRINITY_DN5508_c0_g1_i3:70-2304(+)